DYNRIIEHADSLANSSEVIQGQSMPGNTPLGLGQLIDTNASKLFVLLRAKLGHAYSRVFKDFDLPEIVKGIKGKDIIRVTGDAQFIEQFRKIVVDNWYAENLANLPSHSNDMADALKQEKMAQLQRTDPLIKNVAKIWNGLLPRLQITIT